MNISHILLVCLHRRGGMVHYAAELANALSAICRVTLICSATAPKEYFNDDVEVIHIDLGTTPKEILINSLKFQSYKRVFKVMRDIKFDVFHLTSNHEWNILLGLAVKFYFNKPIVYTMHDPQPHPGSLWRNKLSNKLFVQFPNLIIVHSEKLVGNEHKNVKGKFKVIPHGMYNIFNQYKQSNPQEKNQILYFGRIESYKGIEILLEASPKIIEQTEGWTIKIAGRDARNIYSERIDSLNIEYLNRYVEDRELVKMIQDAKICVFPFTSATQSGSILLALSMGKPVVATSVGAISDIIEHRKTGLLVPPGDVVGLTQAILELAKNDGFRKSLGNEAYNFVNKKYNMDLIAQMHLRAYKEII